MKNKTKYILGGVVLGLAVFLFIPVFPVAFPNTIHTETTTIWFSGLKVLKMGFGTGSFLLHQLMGGVIGFIFPFAIIRSGE